MATIQIREIPEEAYEVIRKRARAAGRSISPTCDTLLLSHGWTGKYQDLGKERWSGGWPLPDEGRSILNPVHDSAARLDFSQGPGGIENPFSLSHLEWENLSYAEVRSIEKQRKRASASMSTFGMRCPSLTDLGAWLISAKPLLQAGLIWYLPSYSAVTHEVLGGEPVKRPLLTPERLAAVDFLIRDGRAVDVSGDRFTKSWLVRSILEIDLPFIEG